MVPRKLHSMFLLIFDIDHLFDFCNQPTVYWTTAATHCTYRRQACELRRKGIFPPTCRRIWQWCLHVRERRTAT